mgnify:CR=1 FL=1
MGRHQCERIRLGMPLSLNPEVKTTIHLCEKTTDLLIKTDRDRIPLYDNQSISSTSGFRYETPETSPEVFDAENDGRAVDAIECFDLCEGSLEFAEGAGVK